MSGHEHDDHDCPVSPMQPIDVPVAAFVHRPDMRLREVGDLSVPEAERTVVKVLGAAAQFPGTPHVTAVHAAYWQPSPEQLEALSAGGFVELILWGNFMAPHALNVWAPSDVVIEEPGR